MLLLINAAASPNKERPLFGHVHEDTLKLLVTLVHEDDAFVVQHPREFRRCPQGWCRSLTASSNRYLQLDTRVAHELGREDVQYHCSLCRAGCAQA